VDLRIGESGPVVDGGVDEPIPHQPILAALALIAPAPAPPSTTRRNGGELLHIDVDQLSWPVPHIPQDRFADPVTTVQPAETRLGEDPLGGRGCHTRLVGDPVCTPPATAAQFDHAGCHIVRGAVGTTVRPR